MAFLSLAEPLLLTGGLPYFVVDWLLAFLANCSNEDCRLRLRHFSFVMSFDRRDLRLGFLQLRAELLCLCFYLLDVFTHGVAPFILGFRSFSFYRPLAPRTFSTLACWSRLNVVRRIVPPYPRN
jgi:hypothetical protein